MMSAKQRMQYLHRNLKKKPQERKRDPGEEKGEADVKGAGTGKTDPGKNLL